MKCPIEKLGAFLDQLDPFPHICHRIVSFLPNSYLNEDTTPQSSALLATTSSVSPSQHRKTPWTTSSPRLFHILRFLLPRTITYENEDLMSLDSHFRHALLPGIPPSFLLGMDMPWEGMYRLLRTMHAPPKMRGLLCARYEKAYGMTHGLLQACLVNGDLYRVWDALSPMQPLNRQFLFAIQVLHWLLEDSGYSRPQVHLLRKDKVLLSQYQNLGRHALAILHAKEPVFNTWSWRCWLYLDMMSERTQTYIPLLLSPQELLPQDPASASPGYPIQYRFYRIAQRSQKPFFTMQPEIFDSDCLINVGLNMMLGFHHNRNILGHIMQSKDFDASMFRTAKLPLFLFCMARLANQIRSPLQSNYNPFAILATHIDDLPFDEVAPRFFLLSGFPRSEPAVTKDCRMVWFDVRQKLGGKTCDPDILRALLSKHAAYFKGEMPGPFPSTFSQYERSQWRQAMLLFFSWRAVIMSPSRFEAAQLEQFLDSLIEKWDLGVIWCVVCVCIAEAYELTCSARIIALFLRVVWDALEVWEYHRDDLREAIATMKQWICLGVLGKYGSVISRVHEFPWSHQTTHNTALVCWKEVARYTPNFRTCLAKLPSDISVRPRILEVCLCLWMEPLNWSLFRRFNFLETARFLRFSMQLRNHNEKIHVLCEDTTEEPRLGSQETKIPEFPQEVPIVPYVTASYQCRHRSRFLSPSRQRNFAWPEWLFRRWPLCAIQDTPQIVSCAEALLTTHQWKPALLPPFTRKGLTIMPGVHSITARIEKAMNQDVPVFVEAHLNDRNTKDLGSFFSQGSNKDVVSSKRQRIM